MPDNSRMNLHCTVPNCKLNGKAKHYHNIDPTAITDGKSWGPLLEARLTEVNPALAGQIKTDAINVPELVSAILEHFGYVSAKSNPETDKDYDAPTRHTAGPTGRTCNYEDCEQRYVDHDHGLNPIITLPDEYQPKEREFGFPGVGTRYGMFFPSDGGPVTLGPHQIITLSDDDASSEVRLKVPKDASFELSEILRVHLPRWYNLFVEKNRGYQNAKGSAFELGIKGQYSDMHRKFMKLKRSMWEGQDLTGEQLDEILLDLVGHIMLTLVMLDDEKIPDGAGETFQPMNPDWEDPEGRQPWDRA